MALGQIGKYERLDVLGHGASGIVYLAKDTLLGRQVALKQISAQGEERERVLGEARVLDRLRHRNIVQVHNVDQTEGRILIDMEYIRGRNLQDILREQPRLTLEQAVSIASQICDGLAFAHLNRTVHRDVKPANILISHEGVVKLVDFGLAEVLGTNSFAGGAGTYAYMAPEDFHAEEQSDRRSDIWAAGVILYEMLTGVRPFRPAKVKDPFSWKKAIEDDPIKPVSTIRPDVPTEIDEIVEKALARSKAQRYDDAAEMLADLSKLGILSSESEAHVAALLDQHPSFRRENGATPDTEEATATRPAVVDPAEDRTVAAVHGVAAAVGSEDATVAAVALTQPLPTPVTPAPVPVEVPGFVGLTDVDDFLRRAPDQWVDACRALDMGSLAAWLLSIGEEPLADVAVELRRPQSPFDASDRLRDFLYRAGLETTDVARKRYNDGVQAFDSGRFNEASTELRIAANLDPSKAYHFQYLARTLWAGGNHAGAVAVFEEALKYHPNDRALRKEHQELAGTAVEVSVQDVDFGVLRAGQEKSTKITLRNSAGGKLQGRVLSTPDWLSVSPMIFATRQRQPLTLTVIPANIRQTPSSHNEAVVLETSGGRQQINVQLTVLPGRKTLAQTWFWYLPLLLCILAPIAGDLLSGRIGVAPGFIAAGLLAGSAFVITIAADTAWTLRLPMLAIAPFCFAVAGTVLGHDSGHGTVRDQAVIVTTAPIVLLLLLQGLALWSSPKGWGRWSIWAAIMSIAGIASGYLLSLFH